MAENKTPEAAQSAAQVAATPETGVAEPEVKVDVEVNPTPVAQAPEEVDTPAAAEPAASASPTDEELAEIRNKDGEFDEERWRNTLKGFREREKNFDRTIKELSAKVEEATTQLNGTRQKLSSYEEQQAREQQRFEDLAKERGEKLIETESQLKARESEWSAERQRLEAQTETLTREVHELVDNTTKSWPEEVKILVPDRKNASAEARLEAMRKAERAARALMEKPPVPGNAPTPTSNTGQRTQQDAIRQQTTSRIYDVI